MINDIIGSDTGLRLVLERVQLVASLDVPVLLLGETGTGKEVISRTIHYQSSRSQGPFLRVNCGAIPADLVDSQLFGHEKGSFTGANEKRAGWFERAHGGTLFLDEIAELSLAAQVRLLRVLQDHQIERVGGQSSVEVDVRIIAATHRDLTRMVHEKTFRQDLWYRINTFPILMPSLAERAEDIEPLAKHFARRAADRFSLAYVEPTDGDIALLRSYDWPGNIRELQAVIDRAAILGNGKSLEVAKSLGVLSPAVATNRPSPQFSAGGPSNTPDHSTTSSCPICSCCPSDFHSEFQSLDDVQRDHILRALTRSAGRIDGVKGAADWLQINPHTLRGRMRKLGIDWKKYRN